MQWAATVSNFLYSPQSLSHPGSLSPPSQRKQTPSTYPEQKVLNTHLYWHLLFPLLFLLLLPRCSLYLFKTRAPTCVLGPLSNGNSPVQLYITIRGPDVLLVAVTNLEESAALLPNLIIYSFSQAESSTSSSVVHGPSCSCQKLFSLHRKPSPSCPLCWFLLILLKLSSVGTI